jgi:methylglutaconyl-CoA hydratase
MDGLAVGGGLELALAADLRVAQEDILMGLPETKLAIIPGAGGTQRLARLIGASKAKEMIFMGKSVTGSEAFTLGLVNEIVPRRNSKEMPMPPAASPSLFPAYDRSLVLAKAMLKNGPVALRMAKIAVMAGLDVDMNAALAIEEMCYAQVIPTVDRLEGKTSFSKLPVKVLIDIVGLNSFQEGRPPKYVGK